MQQYAHEHQVIQDFKFPVPGPLFDVECRLEMLGLQSVTAGGL